MIQSCEREKKVTGTQHLRHKQGESVANGKSMHSLKTFRDRLCDLCSHDLGSTGRHRASLAQDQAQQAVALARELGLLNSAPMSWADFRRGNLDLHYGTEHVVESDEMGVQMVKITIPPAFGLIPKVVSYPTINLRADPDLSATRQTIEFLHATPLEYLERWIAANEVFDDDVKLTSVVEWACGLVSFAISQPQYHGKPATPREIEAFFEASGWERIINPSDHTLFYNYAFQVLAIDALPRNCYLHKETLLPFDVILCHPDQELEKYLKIYPG